MTTASFTQILFASIAMVCATSTALAAPEDLLPPLRKAAKTAIGEFSQIPQERRETLQKLAVFVRESLSAGKPAQITFICTHNSRRSHLAQIWSQAAAAHYGVKNFTAFSGGTEATACNPRTVATLERAGFAITDSTGGKNPVYLVKYSESLSPIQSYSKVYSAEENPKSGFLAAMTCDHADQNCPSVKGAALRVPVHYSDPKISDGKPEEAATYDERSRQIAREMFFMMSEVKR